MTASGSGSSEPHAGELSSRRFHVLAALSIFAVLALFRDSLPLSNSSTISFSNETSTSDASSAPFSDVKPKSKKVTDTAPPEKRVTTPPTKHFTEPTCSAYANSDTCSLNMGQRVLDNRSALVAQLPKNPRAHVFSFPSKNKTPEGQRPFLCVPQKNGNKQFGGFVYSSWHKKPPNSGTTVDHDMRHRWEQREITSSDNKSHVYFIARDPYSRILSMYLQKVVNACTSDGQVGCDTGGWHGIHADTSFKDYVRKIEERVKKRGSLCNISHHLCQQVETCLTTTLPAQNVTILRVEEQSCWFPCLANQTSFESSLLQHKKWELFSGQRCYYTATGKCSNMLESIDPRKVGVTTGNVHATGASKRLNEHYDRTTAERVARLYADDFRVLGYPLWDGETPRDIYGQHLEL